MANCRKEIDIFNELTCTFESGRVNALAFVTEEKAVVADATPSLWSTAAFWQSETYSGDILIHQQVSGEYAASPTFGAGKGNQQERLTGKAHTLTTQVESVKSNNKYWDDLGISTNYRVCWVGDNYSILFVGTTNGNIVANMLEPNDINAIMEWEVLCSWSDIRNPESYDVPAGIFS